MCYGCKFHGPASKGIFFTILVGAVVFTIVYTSLIGYGSVKLPEDTGVGCVVAGCVGLAHVIVLVIVWCYLWLFYDPAAGDGCCRGGQGLCTWLIIAVFYCAALIGLIIWGATSSGNLRMGLIVGASLALGHVPLAGLLFCCLAGMAASHG